MVPSSQRHCPAQPEGTGPGGTAGNFPRGTTIDSNFFRYLGVHEKQSSCVFQAKSAETTALINATQHG